VPALAEDPLAFLFVELARAPLCSWFRLAFLAACLSALVDDEDLIEKKEL
jgi:hypothetical protein